MIQANELRLDNLVYDRNGEIHAIRDNDFHRFRHPTMDGNPSGFKPIPITEEILLKAGFVLMSEGFWGKDEFEIGYITTDENFEYEYLVSNGTKLLQLKYLHQLQNLYFALTGHELEINLTDV